MAPLWTGAPVDPPKPQRGWRWWTPRVLTGLAALFVVLVAWLALTAPLSKSLAPIAPPQITLLAADGTPIARNGANVEAPVVASRLPRHVTEAFLAVEDRNFYSHWGVDPRGLARAAWGNLTSDRTQGGSTITQQLAKFTFLTPERSLTRKAREALIAFWLEAWLTKDQILERYLSNAYFGDNAYGLRAASLHYFYRQPERLTPAQAAMLAGLVKAPSRLAPTRNFKLAEARMRVVLGAMADAGYLSEQEARAMPTPRLDVRGASALPTGTYFADWALPEARLGGEGGYARRTLTTTLDSRLQSAARRAINRAALGKAQVALVAMRANGEVVAMVGGRDYAKSPFNRVSQARRQPGSTFKLFVYLAALRAGWQPDDPIDNRAILTGGYRPQNASEAYSDSITLGDAFARSSNVAAVRLMGQVGSDKVIRAARDLGVSSPLPEGDPSLALGTSGMTLLELTAAYAGIAGDTNPVKPTAFKAPEADWLDWLMARRRSVSGGEREAMAGMLRRAVESGTGRAARLSAPAFGKTGTTQDNRDALFVGFAGDLVVGVWVGNDDNTPLNGITGGGLPARIWRDFMSQALGVRDAPRPKPNPRGPIEPLDVPDLGDIPLGDGNRIRFENGEAVVTTDIGGAEVDVRMGEDGVRIDGERLRDRLIRPDEMERLREQQRQMLEDARRRAQEARERFEEGMR
ncbi:MAG: transglycosylase domain-containing protein [Novosphingobium sp.]|nr:transglycosylase domain-containing protein [Novosphingobium sp.]